MKTSKIAAITVPLVPPSVNHYVKHTRSGRHYETQESKDFKGYIGQFSKHQRVRAEAYTVELWIYLGAGQRGDIDNFPKLVLDGLVQAEVIDSDAKIVNLYLYKRRDNAKPRTEIVVEALEFSLDNRK